MVKRHSGEKWIVVCLRGSILGPLLFIIFINGIDEGILSDILKFADDTKIFGKAGTRKSVNKFRADTEKCKVLHIGVNNLKAEYFKEGKNWRKLWKKKILE